MFEFAYDDFVIGDVDVVDGEFIKAGVTTTLRDGLEKMCGKCDTCLLTLCDSTCAIICQGGQCAVVDSHARGADGMVDERGKSVVVYFSCLEHVFNHIKRFASIFEQTQKLFETAGVQVVYKSVGASVTLETTEGDSGCEVVESCTVLPTAGNTKSQRSEKHKISVGTCTSKKLKSSDDRAVNSDIVFVSDVINKRLQFNPLSDEVAQALCRQLNVESEKQSRVSIAIGVSM